MELVKVWELDFCLAVTDCVEQNKTSVLMAWRRAGELTTLVLDHTGTAGLLLSTSAVL